MSWQSRIFFSVLLICTSSNAYSSEDFLFVSGTGATLDEATIDAKKQLALNLLSEVEVTEKNRVTKDGTQVTTSFEQASSLHSLPIEIPNLELVSSSCKKHLCDYKFKIDQNKWSEQVSRDLSNNYQIVELKLQNLKKQWRDFNSFNQANEIVLKSDVSMRLLGVLNSEKASALNKQYHSIHKKLELSKQQFSVSFRSSSDPFAHQLQSILANKSMSDSQGAITIYLTTSSRKGREGKNFVVQQNLNLKVFDVAAPGVVVTQQLVSELGKSSISLAAANNAAKQKLINKLTNESLYSIFD